MDHLEEARDQLTSPTNGDIEAVKARAQCAIAHALIDIAESLRKMSEPKPFQNFLERGIPQEASERIQKLMEENPLT